MKYLIIVTLVCSVSSLHSAHPGAILPQLSVEETVAELTHHLAKRQADPSSLTLLDCAATELDFQCGPSGYAQQSVDIALACGIDIVAEILAAECAKNENGEVCGAAVFRFILEDRQRLVSGATACAEAVSSGSCPSGCSSFLESITNRLGCCISTTIGSLVDAFAPFPLNDSVWSLCNVSLPAGDRCSSGLQLTPPQDVRSCTPQEILVRFANLICQPNVGQPLVNALQTNSKCFSMARFYVDICRTDANNQYCGEIVGTTAINFDSTSQSPLLTSIASRCDSSSSVCSPSCLSAVTNITNSYGCCVNVFSGNEVLQLSSDLWNKCGIDDPGVCAASTLTLSGAANTKGFAWMIALPMVILMALC